MRAQYNLSIERLTKQEIAGIDQKFTDSGWIIRGFNNTVGSHTLRIYQWEQIEFDPVYPSGFESRTERIDLNHFPRAVID